MRNARGNVTAGTTDSAQGVSTKIALDCADGSAAARWYKDYLGRCGDAEGIAYWNGEIAKSGESAVYATFKTIVDGALAVTTKQAYLDTLLCESGFGYVANTNRCVPGNGTVATGGGGSTATNANVPPLAITTPELLPTITSKKAAPDFRFQYTGGDGSVPYWTDCNGFASAPNYIGITPHGLLSGTEKFSKKSEDGVCFKLWVG